MKILSKAPKMLKNELKSYGGPVVTAAAVAALMLASATVQAAETPEVDDIKFEEIKGSTVKRVILSEKAAERLGLELGQVEEKPMVLKQMFGGEVLHKVHVRIAQKKSRSGFGGFGKASAKPAPKQASALPTGPRPGEAWIRLVLSEEEWARVAQDKQARILPLATRNASKKVLMAKVSKLPPIEDRKRTMSTLYYIVDSPDHGLAAKNRVRIELALKGNNQTRKVVPYKSIWYDGQGVPWVYTIAGALKFERKKVEIERIIGDDVFLKTGPGVGTYVVTVGAALMYGAEVIFKR